MAILDKPEIAEILEGEQPRDAGEFAKQLSERDSIRLIDALEADTEPSDALKKAVERYKSMAVRR